MIDIRDLRYRWPRASADCLLIDHLEVADGRAVFLHGPSGCGKSTLLGLLAGVLVARTGQVALLGQDWAALAPGRYTGFGFCSGMEGSQTQSARGGRSTPAEPGAICSAGLCASALGALAH